VQCSYEFLRHLDARLNAEYRDLRSTLQDAMRSDSQKGTSQKGSESFDFRQLA
jgi:hypothetical protein